MESAIYFYTIIKPIIKKHTSDSTKIMFFAPLLSGFFLRHFHAPDPYPLRIRSDCSTVVQRFLVGGRTERRRTDIGVGLSYQRFFSAIETFYVFLHMNSTMQKLRNIL